MKITIFDVANAACALVVFPNGNSMMIDCGCNDNKDCPVDLINQWRQPNKWLSDMVSMGTYPLTLLHITHPDDDHVRNAEKVKTHLPPYLVHRQQHEEFEVNPPTWQRKTIHEGYKEHICKVYRGSDVNVDWGANVYTLTFQIPIQTILTDESLRTSIANNASIIRWIELRGTQQTSRILFCGDMEEAGWDWLIQNNALFKTTISQGVDILIAPHHGHHSGYSRALFSLIGEPKISVLSKGDESTDETNVSPNYSRNSNGLPVTSLSNNTSEVKYSLTTRTNGHVFVDINNISGIPQIWTAA
jgi:hypothetical protein